MINILLVILLVIFFGFNFSFYYINEEILIFISLTLFFFILYRILKKAMALYFFKEAKAIYLNYYYLFILNIQLISRVRTMFLFLTEKASYSFISEFLITIIKLYKDFLQFEKFKYVFSFNFWIRHFFIQLQISQRILNNLKVIIKTYKDLKNPEIFILMKLEKSLVNFNYKNIC